MLVVVVVDWIDKWSELVVLGMLAGV